jgi:hypothetical protein
VPELGTTRSGNGEFLTFFPRVGRTRALTLSLVVMMELGLSNTALKLADKITTGAMCHLFLSFLGLGLGRWV